MGKRLSKTTKQKIYQRFMSGETNITKLAKTSDSVAKLFTKY